MKKFIYVTLKVARGLAIVAGTSALLASGAHAAAVDLGLWNDESYPAVGGVMQESGQFPAMAYLSINP